MLLAIYDNGVFVAVRDFDAAPTLGGKPWRKFYTVERVRPEFDPATQVMSGPAIEEDHQAQIRREIWTVRAKTAGELDGEKELRLDSVDLLTMKVLLNQENRVRALEGKQAITAAQFRTALKAML